MAIDTKPRMKRVSPGLDRTPRSVKPDKGRVPGGHPGTPCTIKFTGKEPRKYL